MKIRLASIIAAPALAAGLVLGAAAPSQAAIAVQNCDVGIDNGGYVAVRVDLLRVHGVSASVGDYRITVTSHALRGLYRTTNRFTDGLGNFARGAGGYLDIGTGDTFYALGMQRHGAKVTERGLDTRWNDYGRDCWLTALD